MGFEWIGYHKIDIRYGFCFGLYKHKHKYVFLDKYINVLEISGFEAQTN